MYWHICILTIKVKTTVLEIPSLRGIWLVILREISLLYIHDGVEIDRRAGPSGQSKTRAVCTVSLIIGSGMHILSPVSPSTYKLINSLPRLNYIYTAAGWAGEILAVRATHNG